MILKLMIFGSTSFGFMAYAHIQHFRGHSKVNLIFPNLPSSRRLSYACLVFTSFLLLRGKSVVAQALADS